MFPADEASDAHSQLARAKQVGLQYRPGTITPVQGRERQRLVGFNYHQQQLGIRCSRAILGQRWVQVASSQPRRESTEAANTTKHFQRLA